MARRSLTTAAIERGGLVVDPVAVTVDGDVIDAGNTVLILANTGVAAATATVISTATQDGLAVADQVVNIPAGETVLTGPWPVRTFGQPDGAIESGADDAGRVYVDYSTTTSLASMVAAI